MNSSVMYMQDLTGTGLRVLPSPLEFLRMPEVPHKDMLHRRLYDGDFNVFAIGHERSTPDKALVDRVIYNHVYFHYVVGGRGIYNGTPIEAGVGFVSLPRLAHTLISAADDPLHFYWLDFYGKRAEAYVASLGFTPERLVFPFSWADRLTILLDDMLYAEHPQQNLTLLMEACLLTALSYHTPLDEPKPSHGRMLDHIEQVEQLVYRHSGVLTCTDAARAQGLTCKYLNHLFTRYRGCSLQHFIMTVRMNYAADLLRSGNYLGKEIAAMVGYNDYAQFSKMFKKYHRLSPIEYARQRRQK